MRRRYTGKQRADLVDLVRSGRATVAQAAVRLGVTSSTAYYWTREVRGPDGGRGSQRSLAAAQSPTVPRFVQVVPSGAVAPMAVRIGAAEIQVRRGFDAELLRAVVEALGGGT